jgi:hypothetical protein
MPPGGQQPSALWKLTSLLEEKGVQPSMLLPLHELGVKDVGCLINADGTHFITTTDLAMIYGAKAGTRHKQALNKLSALISGHLPAGVPTVLQMKSTAPLPASSRALPGSLLPTHHRAATAHPRAATGTADIRTVLYNAPSQAPTAGPQDPTITQPPPSLRRPNKRKATTDTYARQPMHICAMHLSPSEVLPGDSQSMQTFWQQRLSAATTRYTARKVRQPYVEFWEAAQLPSPAQCTWQQFKTAVCHSQASSTIPVELINSMYNERFTITGIIGTNQYKDEHGRSTL